MCVWFVVFKTETSKTKNNKKHEIRKQAQDVLTKLFSFFQKRRAEQLNETVLILSVQCPGHRSNHLMNFLYFNFLHLPAFTIHLFCLYSLFSTFTPVFTLSLFCLYYPSFHAFLYSPYSPLPSLHRTFLFTSLFHQALQFLHLPHNSAIASSSILALNLCFLSSQLTLPTFVLQ
jgi:hypothetical protein